VRGRAAKLIIAGLMGLIAVTWLPIDRASAGYPPQKPQRFPTLFASGLPVQADLDGDKATDSVKLSSNNLNKTIDIRFANLRTSEFRFAADTSDPGTLVAKDIDGDGDVDLIWLEGRDQKTAIVLINDGKGDFTQAKDNTPYASALNALLSSSDPSDQPSLQTASQILSLTSSPFPDIGLNAGSGLYYSRLQTVALVSFNGFSNRAAFLSYLHKRGPPLILS